MTARAHRLRRLQAIGHRIVVERERDLAEAERALDDARRALDAAEAALVAADARETLTADAAELAFASDHRRTLLVRVSHAARGVTRAEQRVRDARAVLVEARVDEKRFEVLADGLDARRAAAHAKAERRGADEHAARMHGRR